MKLPCRGATIAVMNEESRVTSKSAPSVRLTFEDFMLFPDDGKRHELIDGEHYVTPSPNLRHQTISGRLFLWIGKYLEDRPVGHVWTAPLDVILSNHDVVEPDLIYVSNERASVVTKQNIQGAPDLIIEILSPGTRKTDEVTKRRVYERCGIGEYWIVDPEHDAIKVYRLDNGKFTLLTELFAENDDVLKTPLLPDLGITLKLLFRDDAPQPSTR
jgi:Uma2 family endonuclease